MLIPSAPSASAATSPRPSPNPPDASIGIFTLSAAAGIRIRARYVILAGVSGALEAVDRDDVTPGPLGRQRVAHRGALVEDDDAVRLEDLPDLAHRLRPGGFNDLDPAVDDRLGVSLVVGRMDRREDRQVHPERLVGHAAAALDFLPQRLGRRLRQPGENAEPARVGYRAGESGDADRLHPALDDRMLDVEQFGDAGLEGHIRLLSSFSASRARARRGSSGSGSC